MPQTLSTLRTTAALLFGLLALASCQRQADPNVLRLRYWGDSEEIRIMQGLLKDFEAAHPGVHIKAERKHADASYLDTLMKEFAGGTAPDVIFTATDQFDRLAEGGHLADLRPWLKKEKSLKAADYYPSMVRRFSQKGRLLVLPRDIAPVACIYYNQDLFDAAGLPYPKDAWTWQDLRKAALKLTIRNADGTPQRLGFADDWNLIDAWIVSAGGRVLNDERHPTRFRFAEGGALKGTLFRWRLLQQDQVMPSTADNQVLQDGASHLFMQGKLAMFHSGLWKTPGFREHVKFRWDVAPFPRLPGVKPAYWSGGSGYAMRQGALNPKLCWQLIKFLAGPEGQTRMAATGLAQPALKALAAGPVFLDGKPPLNKKMLLRAAENAVFRPAWPLWDEFGQDFYGPATDALWIHGYKGEPAKLLKGLQKQGNAKYFKKKKASRS